MKPTRPDNRQTGLTMIELLCVIAVLAVLIGLLSPPLHHYKGKAYSTACVSNLKQIALAELVWAYDHDSQHVATNLPTADPNMAKLIFSGGIVSYYQALSNELVSPVILACPSDRHISTTSEFHLLTTNHLSYFLNLDAKSGIDPSISINGDRHITFTPALPGQTVTLTPNLSMQWTKGLGHDVSGNISFVDGSVQKTSNRDLTLILLPPSNTVPQRLLFP